MAELEDARATVTKGMARLEHAPVAIMEEVVGLLYGVAESAVVNLGVETIMDDDLGLYLRHAVGRLNTVASDMSLAETLFKPVAEQSDNDHMITAAQKTAEASEHAGTIQGRMTEVETAYAGLTRALAEARRYSIVLIEHSDAVRGSTVALGAAHQAALENALAYKNELQA
jgi:hypothetical protein